MRYVNFDINILATGKELYVETAETPQETANAALGSPPSIPDDWHKTSDGQEIQTIGEQLHAFLFGNAVGALLEKNLLVIKGKKAVRVRLRLSVDPTDMAAVPWEVIYDPTQQSFLSCSIETPIIRYTGSEKIINGFATTLPLKVLLVVPEASRFDRAKIFTALLESGTARFTLVQGRVTTESVLDQLSRNNFDVVHFVATSGCNSEGDYLLLDGKYEGSERIGIRLLTEIIKPCSNLKLLIFDCHSSESNSHNGPVLGLGPLLIRAGLPAVIAMQFPMNPSSSGTFAKEFYKELCFGDEAGRIDKAVSHARFRVWKDHSSSADFAAPVLFARTPEGMIFWADQQEELRLFSRAWLSALIEKIRPFARSGFRRATRLTLLKDARRVILQNIKLLKDGTADPATKEQSKNQLKNEKLNLAKLEDQLWPWGKTVFVAVLFSLFLGLASHVTMLNKFKNLDNYFTYWLIDVANERRKPQIDNTKVRLVSMENPDVAGLRKDLAELLKILKGSGARVVLFDIAFLNSSPDADKVLGDEITKFDDSKSGPRLLFATEEVREDGSPVDPTPEALASILQGKYGLTEVEAPATHQTGASVLRRAVLGRYVGSTPPDNSEQEIPLYPSLALRAVMAYNSKDSTASVFYNNDDVEIRVGGSEPHNDDLRIPASSPFWDNVYPPKFRAFAHIDFARNPPEIPYSVVHGRRNEPQTLKDWFENRVVLVAIPANDNKFHVANGETWRGAVIQANLISNLLNGRYVVKLTWSWRFLIILLMAAAGLILNTRYFKAITQVFSLSFPLPVVVEKLTIPAIVVVVALVYLIIAESFYESYLLVFDVTYPLIALVASYLGLASARKAVLSKWS